MSCTLKLAGGLLLLAACSARAQETSPYYLGADLGVSSQYKDLRCPTANDCDDRGDFSGRLYGGYTLGSSPLFDLRNTHALELSAFGFGHARSVIQAADSFYLNGKSKVYGGSLNYVSGLELTQGLSLRGKVGLSLARSSVQYATMTGLDNYGANGSVRHNRVGVNYGLGLSYALDKHWSLHGDWLHVPVKLGAGDKTSVNMYSVGVGYGF
ncbi:opacity protein-like surface antigen [Duganella sp. 1224]|uniref:outer membrane beta-barrel protein n=1 Tax=Duganella sp. 1224 TaxID=2587052 RepID=UPI0015C91DA2|nr:outer membrane beta-barrel protein [Duganella sp. 1224]NYE63039.1 opacity protein-like surface antigen [Duganella sp. 1224]